MPHRILAAILAMSALTGCYRSSPAPTTKAALSANVSRDTHERLNGVLWVQTSAEYDVLSSVAYRDAGVQLKKIVESAKKGKYPDSAALEQPGLNDKKLPLAVVLDIDETVLNNSPMSGRLVKDRSPYTVENWSGWVDKKSADFVPGASEFIKAARDLGVAVYFVTNRTLAEEPSTVENLKAVGATPDEILSSKETGIGESAPWEGEKKSRREYIAKTHWIAVMVGDDLGDFIADIRVQAPEKRVEEARKYTERFGSKWFLVPNPIYGSWESVLYKRDDLDAKQLQDKIALVKGY